MRTDKAIEDDSIDFFLDENLTPDDQEYLLDVIEQDEKLSSIVDSLVLRALEVTEEGLIKGPGGPEDDEVLARLSDGEFVFSAEAVEVIGLEKLEAMHNRAREMAEVSGVSGAPITSRVEIEETGEHVEVTEPAADALMRIEERIQRLEGGYV